MQTDLFSPVIEAAKSLLQFLQAVVRYSLRLVIATGVALVGMQLYHQLLYDFDWLEPTHRAWLYQLFEGQGIRGGFLIGFVLVAPAFWAGWKASSPIVVFLWACVKVAFGLLLKAASWAFRRRKETGLSTAKDQIDMSGAEDDQLVIQEDIAVPQDTNSEPAADSPPEPEAESDTIPASTSNEAVDPLAVLERLDDVAQKRSARKTDYSGPQGRRTVLELLGRAGFACYNRPHEEHLAVLAIADDLLLAVGHSPGQVPDKQWLDNLKASAGRLDRMLEADRLEADLQAVVFMTGPDLPITPEDPLIDQLDEEGVIALVVRDDLDGDRAIELLPEGNVLPDEKIEEFIRGYLKLADGYDE